MDCSEVSSNGNVQDPEHIDLRQEQVREAVRNPLQNHDRMDSGRRYCLLTAALFQSQCGILLVLQR